MQHTPETQAAHPSSRSNGSLSYIAAVCRRRHTAQARPRAVLRSKSSHSHTIRTPSPAGRGEGEGESRISRAPRAARRARSRRRGGGGAAERAHANTTTGARATEFGISQNPGRQEALKSPPPRQPRHPALGRPRGPARRGRARAGLLPRGGAAAARGGARARGPRNDSSRERDDRRPQAPRETGEGARGRPPPKHTSHSSQTCAQLFSTTIGRRRARRARRGRRTLPSARRARARARKPFPLRLGARRGGPRPSRPPALRSCAAATAARGRRCCAYRPELTCRRPPAAAAPG